MEKRVVNQGVRVLAGDIGGTKTRLAVFMVSGTHLKRECDGVYRSQDHLNERTAMYGPAVYAARAESEGGRG